MHGFSSIFENILGSFDCIRPRYRKAKRALRSGISFSFRPIDPRVAIVPLLFLPFASTMQLVFHRMPFLQFGVLMLPLYVAMFLAFGLRERVEHLVNPVCVVSLLVVSWGVFLLALRHICSKWSLVGKRQMH